MMNRGGTALATTTANVAVQCMPGTTCGIGASIARLQGLEGESAAPSSWLTIDCNPAVESVALLTSPGPLCPAPCSGTGSTTSLIITTAIAVGDTVVRLESQLPPSAPQSTTDAFLAAGRNFTPEEIPDLHGP